MLEIVKKMIDDGVAAEPAHAGGIRRNIYLLSCQRYGKEAVGELEDYMDVKPPNYWNFERLLAAASKYDSKTAFQNGDPGAHSTAYKRGLLNAIAEELGWERKRRDWSGCGLADLVEYARPYDSLVAFQKGDYGAYQAAWKLKLIDAIAEELGWERKQRDYSGCGLAGFVEYARPFDSLTAFQNGDSGAYQAARTRKLLNAIAAELGWPKRAPSKKRP